MKAKEFKQACEELGLDVRAEKMDLKQFTFLAQDLHVRLADSSGMKSVFISFNQKDGQATVFSFEMTTTEMISGKKKIKWFLTPTSAKTSSANMLVKLAQSQLNFLARIKQTAKEIEIQNAALDYEEEYTSIEETPEKFFNRMTV